MNKNILKVLVPIVAVVVIVESILLLTKKAVPVVNNVVTPTPKVSAVLNKSIGFYWGNKTNFEIPLIMTADKDIFIDALDLYIKYDPSITTVSSLVVSKSFIAPSFKKISKDNGLVVMNFLVSEPSGFMLKKGVPVEVVRLKADYLKSGKTEFSIGDGTLIVENTTVKVLPFNSEKLVINVSR